MTNCAEAIEEVFKSKSQILATKQIVAAVQNKYPDKWRELTIRIYIMGCSVNFSSRKRYPSFRKLLFAVSPGKVRLYDKERDGEFEINPKAEANQTIIEENAAEILLSLERELQEYFSRDSSQLEQDLTLFTEDELTGREVSTEAGKIDILAKNSKCRLFALEPKANETSYTTLGQILNYMASLKKELRVLCTSLITLLGGG
jgi:hypothetical protein